MRLLSSKDFGAGVIGLSALLGACTPRDEITPVAPDDPALAAAASEARASLPMFWSKLDAREPGTSHFRIRADLPTTEGSVEHIWVNVLNHSGLAVLGTLANVPDDLGDLKLGSQVTVDQKKISDWTYDRAGATYGGYTIRVLAGRGSPEERRKTAAGLSPTPLEPGDH